MKGKGKKARAAASGKVKPRETGASAGTGAGVVSGQASEPQTSMAEVLLQEPLAEGASVQGAPAGTRFPALSEVSHIKALGGSTGAALVGRSGTDGAGGERYVLKHGASAEHLREEAVADACYRVLGVPVPEGRLYEADEGGSPSKLARFIEGRTLEEVRAEGDRDANARIKAAAREGFAADALLANWDAAGLDLDNLMLAADGDTYRMDNGGALRYRAMGAPKGDKFSDTVTELDSMRDPNRSAGRVFGGLADAEVAAQVRERLAPRRKELSAALDAAAPGDTSLKRAVLARLDYMQAWAEGR